VPEIIKEGYVVYLIIELNKAKECNYIYMVFDTLNLLINLNKYFKSRLNSVVKDKVHTYGYWSSFQSDEYSLIFEDAFVLKCTITENDMICNHYHQSDAGFLQELQNGILFKEFKELH
jgi:hypothetical protein